MGQTSILEQGTRVNVSCAGGRTADVVVWEDHGDVVLVCGPDQFQRLAAGYAAPMPIGFKRADVGLVAPPGAS